MNTGNTILYVASALSIVSTLLLVLNLLPRKKFKAESTVRKVLDTFSDIDVYFKWLIRVFALLLAADLALLTYYFYSTNLTINYVWTFSSHDLPLVYKLSGVLAGQQGTIFFWGVFIGLSSLWLSETRKNTAFMKKSQIIVLILALFFFAMTLKDSPFKTIFEVYPGEIPEDFVPDEGNGLNPLLIDPWMAVHPPIIFIAYGLMTVPFALAVSYLYYSIKGAPKKVYKEWTDSVISWCRWSWIFLTLGIAIGGFWAYKVLGWGGFWVWDPVETSSIVPWFLLTGALHALIEHKKDPSKYNILAPLLVAWSFMLVMYATLVTRSGFFESVHAFDAGETAFYIIIATAVTAVVPFALAVINSMKSKDTKEDEDITLLNHTNLFYTTIIFFMVFTFISFWGITLPALSRLVYDTKIGVDAAFYNIWTYPIIILTMLIAGLCLNYRPQTKKDSIFEFSVFLGLTVLIIVVELILPGESRNLLTYSTSVGMAGTAPGLYSIVSSVSILSFIPPSVYMAYGAVERFRSRHLKPKKRNVTKGAGILIIHFGVALIVVGSVFSYAIDEEYSVSINSAGKGGITQVPGSNYSIKLLDFQIIHEYKDTEIKDYPGLSVLEFYSDIHNGIKDTYQIHGDVGEVVQTDHNTYIRLVEGSDELWVAIPRSDIPPDAHVVTTGMLQFDFPSTSLNTTFPILMLASDFDVHQAQETISTTQAVTVEVYRFKDRIGSGTARTITYFNGDVEKVMIDRSLSKDVYVIFNGISGNVISLDMRIKPWINLVWIGVTFFTFGMIGVIASDLTPKKKKKVKKKNG
jgi:cytochrome c-type biogenesis protein CcmF